LCDLGQATFASGAERGIEFGEGAVEQAGLVERRLAQQSRVSHTFVRGIGSSTRRSLRDAHAPARMASLERLSCFFDYAVAVVDTAYGKRDHSERRGGFWGDTLPEAVSTPIRSR